MMKSHDLRTTYQSQTGMWSTGSWSGVTLPLKPIVKAMQVGTLSVGIGLFNGVTHAAIITVNNTGDVGTGCTLRDAIVSVNNGGLEAGCGNSGGGFGTDTIVFGGSLAAGGTIALSAGELPLGSNKTLTIDASTAGTVSVIAAANQRVLSVGSSASLTLDSLDISGGNPGANGGGIYVSANASLTVNNSTIHNNSANSFGGAIHGRNDSTISINDSTLTQNTASADGGAIYSYGAGISLTDSFITNNIAQGDEGGGIWSYGGITTTNISLSNTQVTGNSSGQQGGGVYAIKVKSLIIIGNSSVSNNVSGTSANDGNGGGLFVKANANDSTIVIQDSQISNNMASGVSAKGGGIYFYGIANASYQDYLLLKTSVVSGNSATGSGGGIYFYGTNSGSDFSSVYLYDSSSVTGNSAGVNGGGIASSYQGVVHILPGSSVNNNNAAGNGGGVYIGPNSQIIAKGYGYGPYVAANINGNSATLKGGGVYLAAGSGASEANKFIVSNISANKSGNRGGGIYQASGGQLEVSYSTLSANTSGLTLGSNYTSEGGAIFTRTGALITLINSTISSNSASGWGGGGIYNQGVSNIYNSTIFANDQEGVYNFGGTLNLINSIVAGTLNDNDCSNNNVMAVDAFSIIEDGTCSALVRQGDPGLEPSLTHNGGPTRTHLLKESSIARDTGNNAMCADGDQRILTRERSVEDVCDVGAVEFFSSDIKGFIVIPLANGKVVVVPE